MESLGDRLKIYTGTFSEKQLKKLFPEIWKEYYPRLCVYLEISFRISDADDLVQEIMLKVFSRIDSYSPAYSFNTWIFSIARNHAIDSLRRSASAARADSAFKQAEVLHSRYDSTPESRLLQSELKNDIAGFLDNLPSDERQTAFLRYYEDMKYRDISRITGMKLGTVKSHLYNIRKKLTVFYGEYYAD